MNTKKLKHKAYKLSDGSIVKYLPYFHNYEYRHLLRSADYMMEWKKHKKCLVKWFDRKYAELYEAFQVAGLATDGFSIEHSKVIESVFGFKNNEIVNAYHKGV